ncbi:alpha/beta hydrolase family esterase [Pigmentiphaga litoralis]|uniref:extracellular catalytic domain type 1 short-chain-length polyhydroxyalkanoate depolymerase n=1 Tax=Pigmentiphaga litoralis TaxID=516702 RepID=UPI003B4366F1
MKAAVQDVALPGVRKITRASPAKPVRTPSDHGKPDVKSASRITHHAVPASAVPRPVHAPEDHVFANASGRRRYLLYVPASYHGQSVPLIVMLHGCTQLSSDFGMGTRMNAAAEREGFIVAYPEQPRVANMSKCWNWFNPEDQQRESGEPSLIAGITREVMASHAIDPSRVFIAGLSAGGAMAAIMGHAYPDLYAAVGVHSGLAYGSANSVSSALSVMRGHSEAQRPVATVPPAPRLPLIAFQGDADETVHPQNVEWLLSDVTAAVGKADHIVSETGQVTGGHAYTRTVYRDGRRGVLAERWVVHGGGHAWFGGDPSGTYTDDLGPDATREMIRFFLAHPKKLEKAAA